MILYMWWSSIGEVKLISLSPCLSYSERKPELFKPFSRFSVAVKEKGLFSDAKKAFDTHVAAAAVIKFEVDIWDAQA